MAIRIRIDRRRSNEAPNRRFSVVSLDQRCSLIVSLIAVWLFTKMKIRSGCRSEFRDRFWTSVGSVLLRFELLQLSRRLRG